MRASDTNRLNSTLIASNNNTPISSDDYPKAMRYQRRKVIEELMHTERDYVNLLRNLVEVSDHFWIFSNFVLLGIYGTM
jgi:hypothetical protein